MSNRGYAGFYKGIYLRSSYEYAYARYLDFYGLKWKFEMQIFDLGYKLYKPDFFILNPDNSIKKIVEIKSRNLKALQSARNDLEIIHNHYGYEIELVSYQELLVLYKQLPFSLNSVITEWVTSEKTTINKTANGKLNGHYKMKHSEATKKKIGEHTKLLWQADSPARRRMLVGLQKSGMKKGYIRVPRQKRKCSFCKNLFLVPATSVQKYCSQKCSGTVAIEIATETFMKKQRLLHEKIKLFIIEWSIENKEVVEKAVFNRIKPTLEPLLKEIELRYGIKDLRVISKAVFGKDCGRKELLQFMKNVCNENVC